MELLPHGPDGIAVRFVDGAPAAARLARAAEWLRRRAEVVDAYAAFGELLVVARHPAELPGLRRVVPGALAEGAMDEDILGLSDSREHVIEVRYDGEDLAAVARWAGLSVEEVCGLHTGARYEVAAVGFRPGFAYLTGLPEALALPRRSVPRPRVAAGSVAIAAGMACVYPSAGPGGWHLLGHTAYALSGGREAASPRLRVGDRVRFVDLDAR